MSFTHEKTDCPKCGWNLEGKYHGPVCLMTAELLDVLKKFKEQHGKRWKSILRALWESGHTEGQLREIQSIVGPGGNRLEKIQASQKW